VPSTTDNSRLSSTFSAVLVLLTLSIFINYVDRANLSIAAPLLKGELGISDSQLGILLSAFFWTYSCCQLLAGWLVDRFDVKWVFAAGFFLWSCATALTGLMQSLALLIAMRIVLGLGESVAFPSYSKILAVHCPMERLGFANSMVAVGMALGPSVGILFGGTLVAYYGWRPFFIALGLVCLLWLAPWIRWMPSTPHSARLAERKNCPRVGEILRQRSAWGTYIGHFCFNYFHYFMVTWFPSYLVRERHFSLQAMARIGGGVFLLAAISASLCGRLADRWIASGQTQTRVLKTFLAGGVTGVGILLAGAMVAPRNLSLVLLMLMGLAFGMTTSNFWVITQRLAGPEAAGRWTGIQNFFGNLSGSIVPVVTGFLLQRSGHFLWPSLIVSLVLGMGALSWLFIVGLIEPVEWGSTRPERAELQV
jgi:MFS transporter, ACS family, D-galactonate transporter